MKKAKGEMRKKRGEVIILASRPRAAEGRERGGAGKIVFGAGADSFLKEEEAKKSKKKSQMRKGGES